MCYPRTASSNALLKKSHHSPLCVLPYAWWVLSVIIIRQNDQLVNHVLDAISQQIQTNQHYAF